METDRDYIRAAAELLGWNIDDDNWVYHQFANVSQAYLAWHWVKDHIAAELVRQVDALEQYQFNFGMLGTGVFDRTCGTLKGYCKGDDRTMNTIKAIVESGVLQRQT